MQLETNVSEDDLHRFYAFHFWYSPDRKSFRLKRRLYLAGLMVFFLVLFLGALLFINERPLTKELRTNTVMMGALLFGVGFFWAKNSFLRQIKRSLQKSLKEGKNEDLTGHRSMEFTNELILARTPFSETTVKVQVIEKFREDSHAFYIYISAIQAFIVPKHQLTAQEKLELEQWMAGIKRR
jgi:hypothetical protein